MRIQSQFKEYYDSQQKYNTDYNKVFRRNLTIDVIEPLPTCRTDGLSPVRIGFCGTIYNLLYRPEYIPPEGWSHLYNQESEEFIYSLDDYIQMVNKENFRKKVTSEDKRLLSNHLSSYQDDSLFIKYNCPVFVQNNTYPWNKMGTIWAHTLSRPFINNARNYTHSEIPHRTLTEYKFDRIIPAEQAYMEIESYISGVLTREHKEVPEMDNATKVASHGFDKCSFRK